MIFVLMFSQVVNCFGAYSNVIADSVPQQFNFIDQENVELDSYIISSPIKITWINVPTQITITTGEYAISQDGGQTYSEWISSDSSINNDSYLVVRLKSPNQFEKTVGTMIDIGWVYNDFNITTKQKDDVINRLIFTDILEAKRSTYYYTDKYTISWINTWVLLSVSGGEYSLNGWDYTSESEYVYDQDTVVFRLKSSPNYQARSRMLINFGSQQYEFASKTAINPVSDFQVLYWNNWIWSEKQNTSSSSSLNSSSVSSQNNMDSYLESVDLIMDGYSSILLPNQMDKINLYEAFSSFNFHKNVLSQISKFRQLAINSEDLELINRYEKAYVFTLEVIEKYRNWKIVTSELNKLFSKMQSLSKEVKSEIGKNIEIEKEIKSNNQSSEWISKDAISRIWLPIIRFDNQNVYDNYLNLNRLFEAKKKQLLSNDVAYQADLDMLLNVKQQAEYLYMQFDKLENQMDYKTLKTIKQQIRELKKMLE